MPGTRAPAQGVGNATRNVAARISKSPASRPCGALVRSVPHRSPGRGTLAFDPWGSREPRPSGSRFPHPLLPLRRGLAQDDSLARAPRRILVEVGDGGGDGGRLPGGAEVATRWSQPLGDAVAEQGDADRTERLDQSVGESRQGARDILFQVEVEDDQRYFPVRRLGDRSAREERTRQIGLAAALEDNRPSRGVGYLCRELGLVHLAAPPRIGALDDDKPFSGPRTQRRRQGCFGRHQQDAPALIFSWSSHCADWFLHCTVVTTGIDSGEMVASNPQHAGTGNDGDADGDAADAELVLVGAGHAHVEVLRAFAMQPPERARLTVISPESYATYSGMVPGYLAGQYQLREAQIDARALAARARARFLAARVTSVDSRARILHLDRHPDLAYDLVSFDIGSRPALAERIRDRSRTVEVKPIEVAARDLTAALAQPASGPRRIVVVGAGPGGVEVAFAVAARLRDENGGSVVLCDRAHQPVAGRAAATVKAVLRALDRAAIEFIGNTEVESVEGDGVHLGDGRVLAADLVVWATGAAAPELFAGGDLERDRRGFLLVDEFLRSTTAPNIFGAGDCVAMQSHPDLPKAGVYAVREGPLLTANLRATLAGRRLAAFKPQSGFLSLLNTGDGRAILSYGSLALQSRAAWRLKDWIDRRFIERFRRPPLGPPDASSSMGEMRPCGGCAAKVGADVLDRVLAKLDIPPARHVLVGVAGADDAAVFANPAAFDGAGEIDERSEPEELSVATADLFPPFSDDLYLAGRVAAVNAASDLYATGAEAAAAIAIVAVDALDEARQETDLEALLQGALHALREMEIPLVGGHTIAHPGTLVGFSIHGYTTRRLLLNKTGARAGDRLILSKPLGTGVLLAAASAGCADSDWVETAHATMLRSNGPMMRLLHRHAARACTDVTGFGLLGHLGDLVSGGEVSVDVQGDALPALPGAAELLEHGWRSSFHAANQRAHSRATDTWDPLLIDPQTSGGLLAAVPAERVDDLVAASREAGEELHVIGTFRSRTDTPIRIV